MNAALSAGEYFDRIESKDRSKAAIVDAQLKGVTEYLCQRIGRNLVKAGADETRYYTPTTRYKARIDDLVSITSLAVDLDGLNVYGTSISASYYRLLPTNAPADGKPYTHVELLSTASDFYPAYTDSIKVVGAFGQIETPDIFKDLVTLTTRQLRDLGHDGITITVQSIEQAVQMAPGASSLMRDIRASLGRVRMAM